MPHPEKEMAHNIAKHRKKHKKKHKLTSEKAKLILSEGQVRGHKLTKKQKGFFGLIAGGGHPTRAQA